MQEMHDPNGSESILFVGDSITAGGHWQEWFPEYDVSVQASPGDGADRLAERLPAIIEKQPSTLVLLVGANDFGQNRSVEYVVRTIEYFLAKLRQDVPGSRTLVQSILPRGREFADDIQDANRHLRQYAQNVHAQYLDLWASMATEDGELRPEYTTDRLHLTEAGYEAWLNELRPALERLKNSPPMSRPISIIRDERAS
ncbi:MAG TPA: GDSL-type esterase/lipase family protein [Galbitalea sp.]|jgi:lysophospholipase L1-like esterase